MYYIDTLNQLSAALFASGAWLGNYSITDNSSIGFKVGSSSEALAALKISYTSSKMSNATDAYKVFLLYESTSGNFSALLGHQLDLGYSDVSEQYQLSWTWRDLTSGLISASSKMDLIPPFTVAQVSWTHLTAEADNFTLQPFTLYALDQINGSQLAGVEYFPDSDRFATLG